MSVENFSKQLISRYIETECERQLFLDIAQKFPEKWYTDKRKIERPKYIRKNVELLKELGKKYENDVYSTLLKFKGIKYNNNGPKIVEDTYLNPFLFKQLYNEMKTSHNKDFILLEHQYEIPESFFQDLFPPKNSDDKIPVNYAEQRPDIIIIGNSLSESLNSIFELKPKGIIREVPKDELNYRYGINIIDIKNIREDHIGKKQFVEIFYYLYTLSYYLHEYNLENKFFIQIEFNGIFSKFDKEILNNFKSVKDIIDFTILIHWKESHQLFIDIIEKIKNLWLKCPVSIESIPVNIQIKCGHCYFIEDCKKTLGFGIKEPKDWSLKLLPHTSNSIALKLDDLDFRTIGDVANNINKIPIGNTPEPIYSELPLLGLRARSLMNNEEINPDPGHIYTYTLPKFSSFSVTFALETDPANERVYTAGFLVEMFTSPNAPFSGVFDNWWRIWKRTMIKNAPPLEIQKELNKYLTREISLGDVGWFLNLLKKLKNLLIFLKGEETRSGKKRKFTKVVYQIAAVNEDHTNESEAKFTKEVIKKLHYIIEFCNILENYVVVEGLKSGTFYGPATSLFYWSKRQLDNFQDMLERNLAEIINDIPIYRKYLKILFLFNPTDSEVTNPYQPKKLFNVQKFCETIIGIPLIISYTWHEIANKLWGTLTSEEYWMEHFNYMDFNNWYKMILEEDSDKVEEIKNEIRRQIMHKIRTINRLRIEFQIKSNYIISKHANIISRDVIKSSVLTSDFHPIAQVWYLFSRLTGTMDQMEKIEIRTTYPEFSIGKMNAAKVSNLKIYKKNNKTYNTFELKNLSSNMKIDSGDRLLLLPEFKRDISSNRRMIPWIITIDEILWSSKINGYQIKTKLSYSDSFKELKRDGLKSANLEIIDWYLYPISLDTWSGKLYGNHGLLERYNIGKSWLGKRLSYLWNIQSKNKLLWPNNWNFSSSSVYLYSPLLLNEIKDQYTKSENLDLLTKIYPSPDPSQKNAINLTLKNIISAIQGPPGTGKSQTIAALIDEYYERCILKGKKSVHILITAFSYAALRVIIEKIQNAKDNLDIPTNASKLQLIFLRSQYQRPIENKNGKKKIDDLVRYGTSWKLNGESRTVTNTKPLENSLEDCFIMFANAHQLYYLPERVNDNFYFDLICVDEASQLPVDYFISSLQFVKNKKFRIIKPKKAQKPKSEVKDKEAVNKLSLEYNENQVPTKVIIVGDYNQLPPVQPVSPPKNLKIILESLFAYYVKNHQIPNVQLQINYRSNKNIVEFTSQLGIYKDLNVYLKNINKELSGELERVKEEWVKSVLDPKKAVISIIHDRNYEIGISNLEVEIVVNILKGYYLMINPKNKEQERIFWKENVGVVAPHNAQGRVIIRRIHYELTNDKEPLSNLEHTELMFLLKNTIYSVEKFQGSDRELIISSIGLSDRDQISAESEFIYNLNRFNVLTSRAKSKIILIASRRFLKFIPNKRVIMEEAAHIRRFAFEYCNNSSTILIKNEKNKNEKVQLRYKD
ncbi:MAG: hypothetical protein KGD63_15070 [Candidatus Lokiarchaeota archaeon]|nr:hypothetical protein [Candidatus Lokiarchaeota archaeon]